MIYLNNSATTLKKPDGVYQAFLDASKQSSNVGRGSSSLSIKTSRNVFDIRVKVAKYFNIDNPLNVAFTKNATEGLNIAIFGLLEKGDHVITTSSEHNSVLRPLFYLKSQSVIDISIINCNEEGKINYEDIEKQIKPNTKLIVMSRASNVTGNVFDITKVGNIAKKHKITFMVDAAQSVGVIDIDVQTSNIDMLAFTGHKYLFGLQGVGGLYVKDGIKLKPLTLGGNTLNSKQLVQDLTMPELVEAGTLNIPAIISLGTAIDFVTTNKEKIKKKEEILISYFLEKTKELKHIQLVGSKDINDRVSVFSFISDIYDIDDLAVFIDQKYDLITRLGLHCAPLIHDCIGSGETGTLRISLSYFNELEEIDVLFTAFKEYENF